MRRADKQVDDRDRLEAMLAQAPVCRLGLADPGPDGAVPYVIPVFFAFRDGKLYVHSADEGKKIDVLRRNPRVCVEVDEYRGIYPAEKPCGYTSMFRSVIAYGTAIQLTDPQAKREALDLIMEKYAGRRTGAGFEFSDVTLQRTAILEVTLEQITGKQSKQWVE
jgi:nitroimidazol reductase NimA-like FMN-containing flavoprotein (pyridoxamine 5'-phosphate oxidase superfamily)